VTDDEFRAFFAVIHPSLLRYGLRRLDADAANEAAIDALRIIWSKDLAFPESEPERLRLFSLSYTIMDGLIRNAMRAAGRRARLVEALKSEQRVHSSAEPGPAELGPAELLVDPDLPDAVRGLPEADREVLGLLVDGYGVAEIAEVLGVSPGAVSMRLSRLRTKLRTQLRGRRGDD